MSNVVDIRAKMDKEYMNSRQYKYFRILEEAKRDKQLQMLKEQASYDKTMERISELRRKLDLYRS